MIEQDDIDWNVFKRHFIEREGFEPNPLDSRVISLYHYFSKGAHEEMMGRLTPKPQTTRNHE